METKNPDRWTGMAFGLMVLLGGQNAIAVRISNTELPPFWGAGLRFGLSALIFLGIALALRLPLPRGKALVGAVLFGVLAFGLQYALVYWALQYIQAGMAMVILALAPLLTFLLAVAHRLEAFRWQALAGALLSLVGIGLIFWEKIGDQFLLLPMLMALLATVMAAEATVLLKLYPRSHPITTNAAAMGTGMLLLLAFSLIAGEPRALPVQPATWAALGYLVLLGSVVTFALVIFVVKRWTASASSYVFVVMPVVTIISAGWLLGETISPLFLFGAALVLCGVYVGGIAKPAQLRRLYAGLVTRSG